MKSTDLTSLWLKELEARPVFTTVVVAILIRALALIIGFQDYWGDSYHNIILSKLTLDNGWVYSDFKDRHLTWLPAFRYWGSLVIWITGSAKLITLNIANSFLGVAIVGLGTWLVRTIVGNKTAIVAGVLLALMPYLIVFSYMNMAEGFGALLILCWVIGVEKKLKSVIFIAALLAALTRYELVFCITMATGYLIFVSRKQAVLYTIVGIIVGLSIWSWWSYLNTGDLLNWLWMRIESTTLSTDFYAEGAGFFQRFVLLPFFAMLQAFPLIVAFIWLKKVDLRTKEYSLTYFLATLILSGLLFFAYAQTSVIVYPDPRYLVMILPLTVIWFCLIWSRDYFRPFITTRLLMMLTTLSLLQLVIPYYRQFSLQPRIEMGEWMNEQLTDAAIVWSDNAVSIAQSELPLTMFKSSNQLGFSNMESREDLIVVDRLRESKVEYLTVYPAPYTTSHQLFPELLDNVAFEKNGVTFVPVFKYAPYQMQKASVNEYLRSKFEAGAKSSSIWKLYYE